MVLKQNVSRKVKFRQKWKLWRLKERERERERESKVKERLTEGVNSKCEGNEDWCDLKRKLLDVAGEVCHYTKCKPRHSEMWWRNKNVDATVCRK